MVREDLAVLAPGEQGNSQGHAASMLNGCQPRLAASGPSRGAHSA